MHPEIRYVAYPVHVDGTPTCQPPRMRDDLVCGGKHFDWRNGEVRHPDASDPGPDEEARGLRALRRSRARNSPGQALANVCPSGRQVMPLTGVRDNCG